MCGWTATQQTPKLWAGGNGVLQRPRELLVLGVVECGSAETGSESNGDVPGLAGQSEAFSQPMLRCCAGVCRGERSLFRDKRTEACCAHPALRGAEQLPDSPKAEQGQP